MTLRSIYHRFTLVAIAGVLLACPLSSEEQKRGPFAEKAYSSVKPLRFIDPSKIDTSIQLTEVYLDRLSALLEHRANQLVELGLDPEFAPEINHQNADVWVVNRELARPIRDRFSQQLQSLLSATQVDRVKDRLTGDIFHSELERFETTVPDMSHAQRAHVVGLLDNMRENALLELDPRFQHEWVLKYRGIINNYLSAEGYDFTELARRYKERQGE